MISKQKKIQFDIINVISESGELYSRDLFNKLNFKIENKKHFIKIDDALLSLHTIGCITKHITYLKEVFIVKYNGCYKDLGLFLDMVKTCCGSNEQKDMLLQLSSRFGINKQLSNLLINTKL